MPFWSVLDCNALRRYNFKSHGTTITYMYNATQGRSHRYSSLDHFFSMLGQVNSENVTKRCVGRSCAYARILLLWWLQKLVLSHQFLVFLMNLTTRRTSTFPTWSFGKSKPVLCSAWSQWFSTWPFLHYDEGEDVLFFVTSAWRLFRWVEWSSATTLLMHL